MSRSAPPRRETADGVAAPSVGDGAGLASPRHSDLVPERRLRGLSARERIVQASLCLTGGPVRLAHRASQHHASPAQHR